MLRFTLAFIALLTFISPTFADEEEEHTPLGEEMSVMNKSWRKIKRAVSDPAKNASSIELLEKIKKSAVASIDMIPIRSENLSGTAKEEFMQGYIKGMKETVALFDELHSALKANDNGKAAALVKEIDDLRKSGHRDYKPEDED